MNISVWLCLLHKLDTTMPSTRRKLSCQREFLRKFVNPWLISKMGNMRAACSASTIRRMGWPFLLVDSLYLCQFITCKFLKKVWGDWTGKNSHMFPFFVCWQTSLIVSIVHHLPLYLGFGKWKFTENTKPNKIQKVHLLLPLQIWIF